MGLQPENAGRKRQQHAEEKVRQETQRPPLVCDNNGLSLAQGKSSPDEGRVRCNERKGLFHKADKRKAIASSSCPPVLFVYSDFVFQRLTRAPGA
jgi:hypothetical protein